MTDYNNGQDPACEHCGMDPTADANRIEALIAERDEAYRLFAFWRAESDRLTEQLAAARDDAKEAEAYAEALVKERDALQSWKRYWSGEHDTVLAGRADEYDRAEAAEAKLAKAVKLIDLAVELAKWDRAPKLRDDMIDFTTEIKGENHD